MKITILQENLIKALKDIYGFVPPSPQLPLLENILIETSEKGINITATDLSLGIEKTVRAKVEESGQTAVKAKNLLSLVAQLYSGKIDLYLDKSLLIVNTQTSTAKLNTADPKDFPTLKKGKKGKKIKKEVLEEISREVSFSAAGDESRVVLTGVKIEKGDKGERAVATDGFRLSIKQLDTNIIDEGDEIIVPARLFSELERIVPDKEKIVFSIGKEKRFLAAEWKDTLVNAQLVEGKFPDYEKIIPLGFKSRVLIDRDDFEQAVKTSAIFARESANIVILKIGEGEVQISANSPQVGNNKNILPAQVEGEKQKIAFNYRFLIDFLRSVSSKEIILELNGSLKPGVFKPSEEKPSYLHIIMPVRVHDEE